MSTSDSGAPRSNKWATPGDGRVRNRTPAAAQWKKDAQLLDRQNAMADYGAVRREQAANMARLRELRLARDAANALLPPVAKAAPKKRKSRTKPAA